MTVSVWVRFEFYGSRSVVVAQFGEKVSIGIVFRDNFDGEERRLDFRLDAFAQSMQSCRRNSRLRVEENSQLGKLLLDGVEPPSKFGLSGGSVGLPIDVQSDDTIGIKINHRSTAATRTRKTIIMDLVRTDLGDLARLQALDVVASVLQDQPAKGISFIALIVEGMPDNVNERARIKII